MARYAIIQSNIVTNIIEADAVFAASAGGVLAPDASIGDTYDGATFSPAPAPVPSAQEIQAEVVEATQARLDAFARTRNYDGILSAASYAVSTHPPFAAEGRYCADARDATWGALYAVLAEVQAGTRPMPSGYADIEPLLPALEWPL